MSFELSQLKAQLASMEVELDYEQQGRQDSERVLRTQIIEAEQRRDEAMATLRDSSRKCEGLKKKCEVLRGDKQKFSEVVEEMKILVRNNINRAEEVITRAEEELALAKLIRRGADRDLVQWMKTIEDLSQKLATSDQRFATLWKSFKTIAKLLRTSENYGRTWGDFIPLIPERLQSFVKNGVQTYVKNVLAHIRVLTPSVPLEKRREGTDDDNYLESI